MCVRSFEGHSGLRKLAKAGHNSSWIPKLLPLPQGINEYIKRRSGDFATETSEGTSSASLHKNDYTERIPCAKGWGDGTRDDFVLWLPLRRAFKVRPSS